MDPNPVSDAVSLPRSRRVQGRPSLPSLTTTTPPTIPTRSPLRPPLRSISSTPLTTPSTTNFAFSASDSASSAFTSTSSLPLPSQSSSGPVESSPFATIPTHTSTHEHEHEDELDANNRTLTRHSLALAAAVAAANSSSSSDSSTTTLLPSLTAELSSSTTLPPPATTSSSTTATTAISAVTTTTTAAAQMSLMRERHNSFPSIDNLIEAISAEIEGFGATAREPERDARNEYVYGSNRRERQGESSASKTYGARESRDVDESEDGSLLVGTQMRNGESGEALSLSQSQRLQAQAQQQQQQQSTQRHHFVDLSALSMRYLSFNKDKSLPPRPLDVDRREVGPGVGSGLGAGFGAGLGLGLYEEEAGRDETEKESESPVSLVDLEMEDGVGIGRRVGATTTTTGATLATTTTTTTSNRSSAGSDDVTAASATTTSSSSTSSMTFSSTSSSSSAGSGASTANTSISITLPGASQSQASQGQSQSQGQPQTQQPLAPPPMTKRQHALHELLSSERAYASDLALLREVHIPLALGQTAPIHVAPTTTNASTSSQSAHQQSLSNGGSAHANNSNSNAASGSGSNNSSRAVSTFSTSSDPATAATSANASAVSGPIHAIIQAQRISTSSSSSSSLSGIGASATNITTPNTNTTNTHNNNNSVSSLPASISPSISSSLSSLGNAGSEIWSLGPPMTQEDVKIIFGNISDLAVLSDMLCEELEQALGNVLEGGVREDFVGALFLEVIPDLEKPYKQYITRHSTALQHLQNLPQTPALQAYFSYTQSVASSVSHAWDLASLLIKPVQRLLKYPLLLNAILEETPKEHGDKENLRLAREKIEELARNVNEGRRRAEVVKDVLTGSGSTTGLLGGLKGSAGRKGSASAGGSGGGGGGSGGGGGGGVQHPVGVSASVNLSKVKSLKYGGVTAATMRAESAGLGGSDATGGSGTGGLVGGNAEAAMVDAMAGELKRMEVFAQQFAKNVVDWGKMMSNVTLALRTWALSFGKVIGLSSEHGLGSEAFDAFVEVVRKGLMPLTADLEAAINERLLRDLAHLLTTMNKPLKLLASMSEQEPYHYHLLTMPVSSKNRPPASLLAASTNYLALRGQLAAELPIYLKLMHRGFAVIVRRLAEVQVRFWRDVKERWADLWEMLRVEGELNVGWEETCAVWCMRWGDVDELVAALGIMQKPVVQIEKTKQQMVLQGMESQYFAYPNYYVPMAPGYPAVPTLPMPSPSKEQPHHKLEKKTSKSSSSSGGKKQSIPNTAAGANAAAAVQSMFAALEPAHSPALQRAKQTAAAGIHSNGSVLSVSAPLPLGSVPAHKDGRRGRISDATLVSSTDRDRRTSSQDSAHSRQRTASREAQRRRTQGHGGMADEYAEYVAMHGGVMPPPYENGNFPYGGSANGKGVTRMKSMPLSAGLRSNGHTENYVLDSERAYHHYQQEGTGWEEYQESTSSTIRPQPRGRLSQGTLVKSSPSTQRKSKERPTHERKRSGSVKSITSFFTSSSNAVNEPVAPVDPQPLTPSQRDSWVSKPAKYVCQVVHPCRPPAQVSYYSFPFFVLKEGDLYEVLQEAGHPSIHPKLPLYVDDGVDCLLLCRDGNGVVGWALASFLEPLNLGIL